MSQLIIPPGQFAQFSVVGLDSSGNPETVSGSASIDNYPAAFVAPYPAGSTRYALVPKATPAVGQSTTVNVTFNAKDASGNALPPLVVTAVIQGPPAPPLAVSLAEQNPVVVSPAGQPAVTDPGSATITF